MQIENTENVISCSTILNFISERYRVGNPQFCGPALDFVSKRASKSYPDFRFHHGRILIQALLFKSISV